MTNVIIVHGTGGSPDGNWFPWLKLELERLGCRVFVPSFPTPKDQSLENWLRVFEDYKKYLDQDSVVIGHSLGPAFLLSVLENLDHPIGSAFFVAGFIGLLGNDEFDELNKTFVVRDFDWVKIRESCGKFFVMNSEDDPYVPLEKGVELARNLDTGLTIVKNAGHINKESGFIKFELLLDVIKREL